MRGCDINAHRLLCDHGLPITATRIRALLAAHEVEEAATLLTRPYSVTATVVEGRRVGVQIGFPTANLAVSPKLAHVADGVYAGYATVQESRYRAAISVGVPATFGALPATTEATLLDYPASAAPLYGQMLTLEFCRYLRPMQAFVSVEELRVAIAANIAQTRELP
jgi:riboflavin kinase/FMN adenylyltransferase